MGSGWNQVAWTGARRLDGQPNAWRDRDCPGEDRYRTFSDEAISNSVGQGAVVAAGSAARRTICLSRQRKQYRQQKPDCRPDGISRVLPAVFNNTGYAGNESSDENDNQYPCGLVHFRAVSVTDIMLSRQLFQIRRHSNSPSPGKMSAIAILQQLVGPKGSFAFTCLILVR